MAKESSLTFQCDCGELLKRTPFAPTEAKHLTCPNCGTVYYVEVHSRG